MKVGNPTSREQDKIKSQVELTELSGTGSCLYALDFAEVFSNLIGEVNIATVPGGPLWISQKTEDYFTRYLLSPATQTKAE